MNRVSITIGVLLVALYIVVRTNIGWYPQHYPALASSPKTVLLEPPSPPAQNSGNDELKAPVPPITNGYTVFAYDRNGNYLNATSVSLDFVSEEEAGGRTRDSLEFKASILNAACVCTADGDGLPEEYKDQEFLNFCKGKSFLSCQETLFENFEMNEPFDPLVADFCGPYNKRQAEQFVTLVKSRDEIPQIIIEECGLYCSCEGHASQPPKDDDPERGPCTNRVNCKLICPQGPVANNNPRYSP